MFSFGLLTEYITKQRWLQHTVRCREGRGAAMCDVALQMPSISTAPVSEDLMLLAVVLMETVGTQSRAHG